MGDRRENIYGDDNDRLRFLEILGTVVVDYNWLCHGYRLMDNHYHLIIETLDDNLPKGMRQDLKDFVTEMQKRIGKEKVNLNIPKQQKRPIAKPLSEIAAQYKDRKTTNGAIIRKNKNSWNMDLTPTFCIL